MAVTKTWEINTVERDLSDGYVTKVIYRVKGIDSSERGLRRCINRRTRNEKDHSRKLVTDCFLMQPDQTLQIFLIDNS